MKFVNLCVMELPVISGGNQCGLVWRRVLISWSVSVQVIFLWATYNSWSIIKEQSGLHLVFAFNTFYNENALCYVRGNVFVLMCNSRRLFRSCVVWWLLKLIVYWFIFAAFTFPEQALLVDTELLQVVIHAVNKLIDNFTGTNQSRKCCTVLRRSGCNIRSQQERTGISYNRYFAQ